MKRERRNWKNRLETMICWDNSIVLGMLVEKSIDYIKSEETISSKTFAKFGKSYEFRKKKNHYKL